MTHFRYIEVSGINSLIRQHSSSENTATNNYFTYTKLFISDKEKDQNNWILAKFFLAFLMTKKKVKVTNTQKKRTWAISILKGQQRQLIIVFPYLRNTYPR